MVQMTKNDQSLFFCFANAVHYSRLIYVLHSVTIFRVRYNDPVQAHDQNFVVHRVIITDPEKRNKMADANQPQETLSVI